MKEGEIVLNGKNFSWESVLQHIPSDGAKCPSTPITGMDWRVGHSIMMETWREMSKFQYFYNSLQPPPFSCTGGKMFCDTLCDTSPVSVDAFESTKVIEEKTSDTIASGGATSAYVFTLDEEF
jgi:hypothetical protein